MNLKEFMDIDPNCPVCGDRLTPYLQLEYGSCLQGSKISDNHYNYKPFKNLSNEVLADKELNLKFDNDIYDTPRIGLAEANKSLLSKRFYLYFLCNDDGFKDKGTYDYEIDLYKGCYYRSTIFMKEDDHGKLICAEPINTDNFYSYEAFSITDDRSYDKKVYMLNMNYQTNSTDLWQYSFNEESFKENASKPKVFHKNIPILGKRPNFELDNRNKLFVKFDSWILMS